MAAVVKVLCMCVILLVLVSELCSGLRSGDHTQHSGGFVYTLEELLRLRLPASPSSSRPLVPVLNVTRDASRQRKRGRRGGVKTRLRRRQARPPPPICSIRKHSVTKQQNGRTSRNVPITFPSVVPITMLSNSSQRMDN